MKKISAIIAVLAVAAAFAFAGCQKQEATKPASMPAMSPSSAPSSTMTTTAPMAPMGH